MIMPLAYVRSPLDNERAYPKAFFYYEKFKA